MALRLRNVVFVLLAVCQTVIGISDPAHACGYAIREARTCAWN